MNSKGPDVVLESSGHCSYNCFSLSRFLFGPGTNRFYSASPVAGTLKYGDHQKVSKVIIDRFKQVVDAVPLVVSGCGTKDYFWSVWDRVRQIRKESRPLGWERYDAPVDVLRQSCYICPLKKSKQSVMFVDILGQVFWLCLLGSNDGANSTPFICMLFQ